MSKTVVLITGGTSRTGRALAELLLPSPNFTVRLGSRDPSKLTPLVSQGAEAALLNSKLETMQSALKGVSSVFFIYPALTGGPGDTLVANFFLALTRPHTITHIVYLSSMRASPNDPDFELAYKHWRNEQQLIQALIPYTILRPTYFHENLVTNFAEEIKRTGEYRTSAGDGVWTSVAVRDVAAVAMAAIANPDVHANKTYELREEAVTHEQVAEKISRVSTGKKVKMVNLTPEEHHELVMKACAGAGNATALADQVVRSDKEKRDGLYSVVTPDLEAVLGRKGETLDEFLEEHAGDFKADQ